MDTLLRPIPKVDDLLRLPALNTLAAEAGTSAVTEAVRRTLDRLRADILVGTVTELPSTEALCAQISALCRASRLPSLRGVINATGIVLHTNLGRACLSDRALAAARGVSQGYSTLEYDLTAGERGQRYAHVEPLLCRLTGAEAAMVVNNNAAAVLLILSALTAGGEVITSRGELVEIGGSFRSGAPGGWFHQQDPPFRLRQRHQRADPRPFESPHQQLPHRGLYGERVPRRLSGAWPLPQHPGH